jgi:hypothetical protein
MSFPRAIAPTAVTLSLLAALSLPAAAFSSVPPGGSVHDEITESAARTVGWPPDAIDDLQGAVAAPDFDEAEAVAPDGAGIGDRNQDYSPSHHCDRVPPNSDMDAFAATVAYIELERNQSIQFLRGETPERALLALGRALHALQDCHSHSNIVDLPMHVQIQFQRVLVGGGSVTESPRLTGFRPDDAQPTLPEGDPYPHGNFSKDHPGANDESDLKLPDGRNKFQASRDLAIATTTLFLEDYLARLTADERAQLFDAEPPETQGRPKLAGPIVLWALVIVVVLVVAYRMRNR